jgi:hypothetical protein
MKDDVVTVVATAVTHGTVRSGVDELKPHDVLVERPCPADIRDVDANVAQLLVSNHSILVSSADVAPRGRKATISAGRRKEPVGA